MTLDAHVTGIWCGQIGGGVGKQSIKAQGALTPATAAFHDAVALEQRVRFHPSRV